MRERNACTTRRYWMSQLIRLRDVIVLHDPLPLKVNSIFNTEIWLVENPTWYNRRSLQLQASLEGSSVQAYLTFNPTAIDGASQPSKGTPCNLIWMSYKPWTREGANFKLHTDVNASRLSFSTTLFIIAGSDKLPIHQIAITKQRVTKLQRSGKGLEPRPIRIAFGGTYLRICVFNRGGGGGEKEMLRGREGVTWGQHMNSFPNKSRQFRKTSGPEDLQLVNSPRWRNHQPI